MPDEATRLMSGLIPCPQCGTQVSIKAKKCPDCGAAMPGHRTRSGKKKFPTWLWVVLLLFLIACEAVAIRAVVVARRARHTQEKMEQLLKETP